MSPSSDIGEDTGRPKRGGRRMDEDIDEASVDRIRLAVRGSEKGRLDRVAAAIASMASHYTGVYLYRLEGEELVLRGFAGRPSPHTRIPVGRGICGTAIRQGRDMVVPNVAEDSRYLACSPQTRSELVVLMEHEGQIVGEIDVDSDLLDPFTPQDLARLRQVARVLAPSFA